MGPEAICEGGSCDTAHCAYPPSKVPSDSIKSAGDLTSSVHHPSHSDSHVDQGKEHYKTSFMQRTLASYEPYRPHSTWPKLGSPIMSRSGKGKAVDRSAQQSSHEDDYSDDDEYDDDDWKRIEDPGQRRKIQNRLAQRKFREKTKIAREESIRHSQNQAAARNAYSHPDPRDLQHGNASSGLPWGGVSIKHVVERGKEREQRSAQRSREGSVAPGGGHDSRGGRDGSVGYYSSDRGGRGDSYSYYGSARGGGGGGGYSAGDGGRGSTASDRGYYESSRGRGDYSR